MTIVRGTGLVKSIDKTHYDSHHEAWLLLPWYANGSIDRADKQLVERHLRVCLPCRGELINQRMLQKKVCETKTFEITGQRSFSRLQSRIHRTSDELTREKALPALSHNFPKWMMGPFVEKWVQRPAVFAFSILLFFLIPLHFQLEKPQKTEFRTLATPPTVPASKNDVRIVFSSQLNQKQMDEILGPVNGLIVEGPSAHNVFRVRIENSQSDLATVISRLRADAGVVFAEPLFPVPRIAEEGIKK